MMPTTGPAKTIGTASLPGMISGLILTDVDPVHTIKYQIVMTFMLLSVASIGSVVATYFAYEGYYNQQEQLAA